MSHRIAIATSDGKFIDTHFGHADRFLIVDLDSNGFTAVETRKTDPACRNYDHDESSFDYVIDLLKDCQGVFVSRIGQGAAQYVLAHGLRVFEAPYFIEDVLKKLMNEGILNERSY